MQRGLMRSNSGSLARNQMESLNILVLLVRCGCYPVAAKCHGTQKRSRWCQGVAVPGFAGSSAPRIQEHRAETFPKTELLFSRHAWFGSSSNGGWHGWLARQKRGARPEFNCYPICMTSKSESVGPMWVARVGATGMAPTEGSHRFNNVLGSPKRCENPAMNSPAAPNPVAANPVCGGPTFAIGRRFSPRLRRNFRPRGPPL